jgi:beta-ribofuranosylaminobenzene 5'-phosphate synthase
LLIRAPARLHLGFLDPDGWLGRRFASIGFAISEPETVLTVKKATAMTASGHELARTQKLLERFATDLNLKHSYAADVQHAIPAHAGLGSGTQLALALGTGLLRLEGAPIGTRALGEMVDRGARSAIGMTAFDQGGFIVDGGKTDSTTPPPVLMRSDMPQHWRIVLILDPEATGVHGQMEREAFTKLDRLPQKTAAHLCHLTMMQMLPALKEADLAIFGSAVSEMQEVIGAYFAPMQGGSAWASPAVQEIAQKMKDHGAVGIGQSSWGPTGYGFVEDQPAAERLYRTLVEDAKAKGLSLKIVAPRNSGATIDLV